MTAKADQLHIGLIVEGKGDEVAVPLLLRKYLSHQDDYRDILGKPVWTNGISNATKPKGIEGYAAAAAYRPGCRGVMVVLDADDDCAVDRAVKLRNRIAGTIQQPFAVALAERTYEDWLYSSIESLRLQNTKYVPGGNGIKKIKMALPEKYVKPIWQPRLTDRLDISLAKSRSKSLDRMLSRFQALVDQI
jgi:hypothetical protein